MVNSIELGKVINTVLEESLNTDPQSKRIEIYPLIADNDAKYPFVVYQRSCVSTGISKDGVYEDTNTVKITVVASNYPESVAIAQKVRKGFEFKYRLFEDPTIKVYYSILVSSDESFEGDAFIQTLTFTMKTN